MTERSSPSELRDYLKTTVNPIVEPMVLEILKHKPADIYDFMIHYLQEKKAAAANGKGPAHHNHNHQEAGHHHQHNHHHHHNHKADEGHQSHSSDDEDDEEEDEEKFEQERLKKTNKGPRASISAEVYGTFNKKENFVARVIQKTPEQKKRIMERLSKAFMFAHLDEKEKEIVVNAMEEKTFAAGSWVIKQGEDGNELFVIDQGKLECFKQFKKGEEAKLVKTYNPGESFGELALLYNAPRAASIKAVENSVLYALDRPTFNNIVKDAEVKRRERFEAIISKVELLESMDPYERSKIADAAVTQKFKAGDHIIKLGERGDKFYFLEDGEAIATKPLEEKGEPVTVLNYKAGDYFGELALLRDAPRAANVVATTDLSVLALDREAFTRVLGPLTDILKRNMKRYQQYAI